MHYFSNLFGKELYIFRTDLLSIIRSISTVFAAIGICHASDVDCLLARSGQTVNRTRTTIAVNTVLRLLIMGSKSVRNM
jgi:hypothetical protein